MASKGWCQTELNISWQLKNEEPVCIRIQHHKQSYCFDKGLTNQHVISVKVKGPIKIKLIAKQSQEIIATSTLNVFVQEYRKRARQRHAWSIIQ